MDMTGEPGDNRGPTRRQALTMLALGLPTACAAASVTTAATSEPLVTSPAETPFRPAMVAAKPAGRGGPVRFRPGHAMWGSYTALRGLSPAQSLALRRRQLGRGQRIVHRFYPWSGYLPTDEPAVPADSVLMMSWHGVPYRAINNGSSDRMIASTATKLARMRRPIMLRWGWEMNTNWFAWGGAHNGRKPAGYVAAWRRLHRIFDQCGARNVAWVWSPNWNSAPNAAWNQLRHYYPGDAYVDWVGVDGYNFAGESPRKLFGSVCATYGRRKPIVIAETAALGSAATRARWIKQLSSFVKATPSVGAVVWFDTDVQPGTRHNFRPDIDARTLAAYRTTVRSARFSG